MTESVATPHSRSNRPSAKPRRRAAAAAGRAPARASIQPGGDAHRDERTLDLFGDPVMEAGEVAPAAVRSEAAEAAASDAPDHQQATLDGFGASEARVTDGETDDGGAREVAAPGGEVAADGVTAEAGHAPGAADAAAEAAFESTGKDMPARADYELTAEAAVEVAPDVTAQDVSVHTTDAASADRVVPNSTEDIAIAGAAATLPLAAAAAVSTKDDGGAATKPATPRAAGARSSTGTKRRTSTAAAREAAAQPAPAAADAVSEPRMTAPAVSAEPSVAAPERDAAAASAARPAASAATFVTKPSADRAEPSFDADAHLRPLSDRLAALQAETTALHRAADREMRRVNRLLLALAVVVLAGLVALVMQTMQLSHLKLGAVAQQQRIDRLTADLATQQATITTLEQHNDALLSQVDRLERHASRQPAVAKRVRRGR
ncbi:hypothetical protein [Burkholderia ubonensis]|uniref:Flagellar hook-length control protein FliK n=1 Tax=Burkholderia ubonensis subsp. mesacidophila TaxID=265293 RepID=A0A2A4FAY3_9BURK|nr:hypothetical protein [Burkholderia ubonensis]PCE29832.1 hypothetical protein BZL54_23780 [Burkholderia ubonensis subsp. mesacidophila]